MKVSNYLNDGANYQAQAALAFLRWSFQDEAMEPDVARWENCREQGYVLSMIRRDSKTGDFHQFNIAFFEHRNSDRLCAIQWTQKPSVNSPTIDTADFNGAYKDKYDVNYAVSWGEIKLMADWIYKQFEGFDTQFKTKE